jgi:DNA repair exonuclease SbcCD ATPase subunit
VVPGAADNGVWDLTLWLRPTHGRSWWSIALGPYFLLLTLLAAGLRVGWPTPTLVFLFAIAFPLCWFYGIRGFVLSFVLTVMALAVDLHSLSISERIWHLGVGCGLNCALLVLVLGQEAAEEALGTSSTTTAQRLAALENQLSRLQREEERILPLERQVQELHADLARRQQKQTSTDSQLAALQTDLARLSAAEERDREARSQLEHSEEELRALREEVRQRRTQREKLEGDAAQLAQLQQQVIDLREEKARLEEQVQREGREAESRVQQAVDRYKQLRGQFKEKGEALHQSRVSVWQVETRLETLLREQAERNLGGEAATLFVEPSADLVAQVEAKEEEIGRLEELISQLLTELKRRSVPGLSGLRVPPR